MSLLRGWRYRLGVRLLRPHWLPLLEHYNAILDEPGVLRPKRDGNIANIVIGIKHAIGVGKSWSRY